MSTAHSNSPGDYYGRITRPVVYFLLAKLALNAEVFTDNDWTDGLRPNGREIYFRVGERKLNAWQTVVAYCDSITDLNYSLSPNYADNFSVFMNRPERIFSRFRWIRTYIRAKCNIFSAPVTIIMPKHMDWGERTALALR